MIVKPITFPNHQPLNRTLAAQVVQTASRFDARMKKRHRRQCCRFLRRNSHFPS